MCTLALQLCEELVHFAASVREDLSDGVDEFLTFQDNGWFSSSFTD